MEAGSSATSGVARTCTREQPIEDIGSTGRVHESSRLSMAKLKLNGVSHVCQTCQGDVNMPPEGQGCQLKHGRETQAIYNHVCQTCQGDVNMPPEGQKCQLQHGRETQAIYHVCQTCQGDVNMPPEGQKCQLKHGRETQAIYLSIYFSNLSI